MKKNLKFLLVFVAVFLSLSGIAQNISKEKESALLSAPKVDRRVELLSIVFRLAGNSEYNGEYYKNYVNDIYKHFDKYKNHPLIEFAKEMADSNGIGYDAVMEMAIHVEQPPSLKPILPFNDSVPEQRWGATNANKFVALLQKFYVDADCETFFKEEENTYRIAEERFRIVFDKLDLSWYKKYYGQVPEGKFNVVIGLGNGDGNFGCKIVYPDKKENIYAIMGSWTVDSLGAPIYAVKDYLPTLIHEFNHTFVNFLIFKNEKMFEESGVTIYNVVWRKMLQQAYSNWQIMYCEALVRASVIEYLKAHDTAGGKQAEKEAMEQLNNGFLWIKDLVSLLDKYESNRRKYPTLESFIPEIATFYNGVAKNIDTLKENYNRRCPHVASIEPFKNKDTNVNPELTEIKITFDKVLSGKGCSIGYGSKGKEYYPTIKFEGYLDNNTAIKIHIALKPNTEYQFKLLDLAFQTADGYPLEQYEVDFKTTK